ncbi:MAG: hypothetical protein FJ121_07480 [Deltaproteobacteria bacterium]|nr:hypothetical protein [Deltaproteobacteria bacterium]
MEGTIYFILGVLATLVVGVIFYFISARYLTRESSNLRRMVNILGIALESNGYAKFNWDENGNMKGVVRFISSSINAKSSLTATITVDQKSAQHR